MKALRATLTALAILLAAAAASARLAGAYYGTNYTVPFAHAYRALGELGVDRHSAIDRDVYHMARLGFNGFRLHLWDTELSDANGTLLDNEHLELLDYLIARLEERNISIILTAQTNFGNGYPERNTNPYGAFSYNFEKCHVHDDAAAQTAQQRYLDALARHTNRYTGKSYAADPAIVALEINNEPCHSGTHSEITAYINRMAKTLRSAGWQKDIIYNVSHNLWRTSAFYKADIDGTTYQWYPTGLVRGSRRHGNFLPVLDSYDIPFDTVPGYAEQPKLVYEYDPADVLETYLYPAAARTFRKEGFDWVTQFAYDPIDMARFNTEYQTHFLNLAYTPGKAIGMAIAAEVMRRTPKGADYGKYPVDTVFGDFLVSARRDIAMLNDGEYFYHTNGTTVAPKNFKKLRHIAAAGSSPAVATDGTGAYFLDRLDKDTWRLELMPDVVLTADPFARPSLKRTVGEIIDAPVNMTLDLPGLGSTFAYAGSRGEGMAEADAKGGKVSLLPGVYILSANTKGIDHYKADYIYNNERKLAVGEYAMPPVSDRLPITIVHQPRMRAALGSSFTLDATVLGSTAIDSVVVYPATVDFWRDNNKTVKMARHGKYGYSCTIKADEAGTFSYYIVVFSNGKATTYPTGESGTPLDWDFAAGRSKAATTTYSTAITAKGAPIVLLDGRHDIDGAEFASIPEYWRNMGAYHFDNWPAGTSAIRLFRGDDAPAVEALSLSKYVGNLMECYNDTQATCLKMSVADATGIDSIEIGLVTRNGFTYAGTVSVKTGSTACLQLDGSLTLVPTLLNPAPYPSFLGRRFVPDPATAMPFNPAEIEAVVIYKNEANSAFTLDITGVWLE